MAQKVTAVEWLEAEFVKLEATVGVHGIMYSLIDQAKAMEKEQHGETWDAALIQVDKRGGVLIKALVDFDKYWEDDL
jgi:hypothetical protein